MTDFTKETNAIIGAALHADDAAAIVGTTLKRLTTEAYELGRNDAATAAIDAVDEITAGPGYSAAAIREAVSEAVGPLAPPASNVGCDHCCGSESDHERDCPRDSVTSHLAAILHLSYAEEMTDTVRDALRERVIRARRTNDKTLAKLRRITGIALTERPLNEEEFMAIKFRWGTGPERYQQDADRLIGGILDLRAKLAATTRELEELRAVAETAVAMRKMSSACVRDEEILENNRRRANFDSALQRWKDVAAVVRERSGQ